MHLLFHDSPTQRQPIKLRSAARDFHGNQAFTCICMSGDLTAMFSSLVFTSFSWGHWCLFFSVAPWRLRDVRWQIQCSGGKPITTEYHNPTSQLSITIEHHNRASHLSSLVRPTKNPSLVVFSPAYQIPSIIRLPIFSSLRLWGHKDIFSEYNPF